MILATGLTWVVFHGLDKLSPRTRLRALLGTSMTVTDLAVPVDPERDHIRGPKKDALITLVEYGDFECPYCGQAEPAVRELVREFGELRFVFRHLPLTEVHPHAQLAAEGAEAAAKQGKFWEMHDMLMDHQGALTFMDLVGYAGDLGLDTEKFAADLRKHAGAYRVAEDVDSADLASVSGTPTFFINGNRYYGAFDLAALQEAVHTAKGRAVLGAAVTRVQRLGREHRDHGRAGRPGRGRADRGRHRPDHRRQDHGGGRAGLHPAGRRRSG